MLRELDLSDGADDADDGVHGRIHSERKDTEGEGGAKARAGEGKDLMDDLLVLMDAAGESK